MKLGIDIDFLQNKVNMAKKFMFSDETKKLREYADLFALFNQNVYKEVKYFEAYMLNSIMGNFKLFSEKNIEIITQNHLMYADMLSDIGDIKQVVLKAG